MHQSSYYGWHPSVSEVISQCTCEETDNNIEQNWKQESKVDVPRDAIHPHYLLTKKWSFQAEYEIRGLLEYMVGPNPVSTYKGLFTSLYPSIPAFQLVQPLGSSEGLFGQAMKHKLCD